jgi:hypothetical protein
MKTKTSKLTNLRSAVRFARFLVSKGRHLSAARTLKKLGASTELVTSIVWRQG